MDNLPKIAVRPMPSHPSLIEVDLVWPGEYKTMLTFHKDDFNEGVNRGKVIIEAHVGMVKRHIDYEEIKALMNKVKSDMELEKTITEIKATCIPNRSAEK